MTLFKRIEFWAILIILAALGQKFYGFGRPMLGHQAWREADTAAIARNFYEGDPALLWPQVDWGGPGPNYVESELPLFPYAAAAVYKLTGVREAAGRSLALAGYAAQLLLFFLIGRRLLGKGAALAALGVFALSPINGFMARAFMAESWVMAASLASAYYYLRWLDGGKAGALFGAAAFLSLAALLKLTALNLLVFYFLVALFTRRERLKDWRLWAGLAALLVPVAAWYWHAHRIFLQSGNTFGVWFASRKWASAETILSGDWYLKMLKENLAGHLLTAPGLLLAVAGVAALILAKHERRGVVLAWLASSTLYLFVLGHGVYDHDYYALPFLAPAALAAGYAAAAAIGAWKKNVPGKIAAVVAVLAIAAAVPSYTGQFRKLIKVNEAAVWAGEYLAAKDAAGAPIVTFNNGGPQWLYYAHRKGWVLSPKGKLTEDPAMMDKYLSQYYAGGARFFLADMNYYGVLNNDVQKYLDTRHERFHQGEGYAVWRLLARQPAPITG